jgi:hypothetical protein
MATLPTAEQSARAVLAIFAAYNVRAGEVLVAGQVNMKFLTDGGTEEDYEAGLHYAGEQGWLEPASGGTNLRLTEAGFAEM